MAAGGSGSMFSQRATMVVFLWAIFATMSLVFMLGYEFHAHNTINHDEIVPRVRKPGEAQASRRHVGIVKNQNDDDDDKAVVHHAAKHGPQLKSNEVADQSPVRVCRDGKPVHKLIYIKVWA
jgi:hypothetical protein